MIVELDAGQIVIQKEMLISDKTYISDVYDFIGTNCPEMFLEAVNGFGNKSIKLQYQPKDSSLLLRCYPRIPKDGEIDWNRSGFELDKLIRTVSKPFSGAYTFLNSKRLIVWKAHCESSLFPFFGTPGQVAERRLKTGEVAIITDEGFLVLEEVEIESKGCKKATNIIKTTRTRLGMDITGEILSIKK